MSGFVDLEVIEGPEKGMRYTIEEGTYRVLGRRGDENSSTLTLKTADLDDDTQAAISGIFRARESRVRTRFQKRRGADILLDDESISKTHALVFVDKSGVSVADLMSTNGTRVNGERIDDADIQAGDVIVIGQSKIVVRDG